jgi:hypothetical protein
MVGCAHYILGPFARDPDLRRHGQRIASRGGKNGPSSSVSWRTKAGAAPRDAADGLYSR